MKDLTLNEALISPWQPMTDKSMIKYLGKLGEEFSEAVTAIFRCLIQGIDESHPITKKPNKEWLLEEIADAKAGIELLEDALGLDKEAIEHRKEQKKARLRVWHDQL